MKIHYGVNERVVIARDPVMYTVNESLYTFYVYVNLKAAYEIFVMLKYLLKVVAATNLN